MTLWAQTISFRPPVILALVIAGQVNLEQSAYLDSNVTKSERESNNNTGYVSASWQGMRHLLLLQVLCVLSAAFNVLRFYVFTFIMFLVASAEHKSHKAKYWVNSFSYFGEKWPFVLTICSFNPPSNWLKVFYLQFFNSTSSCATKWSFDHSHFVYFSFR